MFNVIINFKKLILFAAAKKIKILRIFGNAVIKFFIKLWNFRRLYDTIINNYRL